MIEALIKTAADRGASDLHIKADSPPLLRIDGELRPMNSPALGRDEAKKLAYSFLSPEQIDDFENKLELDLAAEVPNVTRFRANVLQQRGSVSAIIRLVAAEVQGIDEMGLPPILKELSLRPRGLILVTGPAGSGKSTTQAALIEYINRNAAVHIMTIEDPIEFLHTDKQALINQRELGQDTNSFRSALKHVLRQDPDVILIGEMRSLETISLAITAAETGHLVIGTLHTPDTIRAIDRIVDVFPPYQQAQIRIQLANNLLGVVSQHLVRRSDGPGRVPAFEILVGTPAIKGLIRESKSHQVRAQVQIGSKYGMHTMDQDLVRLIQDGTVDLQTAREASLHPEDLRRQLSETTDEKAK